MVFKYERIKREVGVRGVTEIDASLACGYIPVRKGSNMYCECTWVAHEYIPIYRKEATNKSVQYGPCENAKGPKTEANTKVNGYVRTKC